MVLTHHFYNLKKKRKKSGKWSTKLTTAKTFITIITTLGIFILGILNFKDNKTIKLQEIKIESLNKTIDSLKNELTKPMQLDIIQ